MRLNLFQSLAIIFVLWVIGFYTYATWLNHARAVTVASDVGQYQEVRK